MNAKDRVWLGRALSEARVPPIIKRDLGTRLNLDLGDAPAAALRAEFPGSDEQVIAAAAERLDSV